MVVKLGEVATASEARVNMNSRIVDPQLFSTTLWTLKLYDVSSAILNSTEAKTKNYDSNVDRIDGGLAFGRAGSASLGFC